METGAEELQAAFPVAQPVAGLPEAADSLVEAQGAAVSAKDRPS